MVRRLTAVAAVLLLAATAFAADVRTQRLETLCRVWTTAKYKHPALMMREIDWDAALLRAIPAVRAAESQEQFAAAIEAMLRELGDPVTRVTKPAPVKPPTAPVALTETHGDVLRINIGPYAATTGGAGLWSSAALIEEEIAKAREVVIDLTVPPNDFRSLDSVAEIVADFPLTTTRVPAPSIWTTFHSGYAPQDSLTSGGYYSALQLLASPPIAAAKQAPQRVTFLTDGATPLPPVAVALRDAGKASIVASAPLNDAAAVTHVDLGGGESATIRTATYASQPLATAHFIEEKPYVEMTAPDLPHRLLAAFRMWGVIHTFYPYKQLIGDWDAVLREFIPRFEEAEGEDAYAAAVLEMSAHVEDGHMNALGHPGQQRISGMAGLPLHVRMVEGQAVVAEKLDAKVPVEAGDVIVAVDGEPLEARVRRLWKYFTASTETARRAKVMAAALRGAPKSVAHLEIRGADGKSRTVDVPRITALPPQPNKPEPYGLLDGNIGYADLRQLTTPQVDAMFDALGKTKAIIFDMRGYPKGTAWAIAPRINTRHAVYGASFRRVQITGIASGEEAAAGYYFDQPLPTSDKPVYAGKIVVLIDHRAISQAEHSCLFFEQAAGATFIGTPTAGANGDVSSFPLPGGFTVYFTGHDVRHADGRQLQRVGIQPDIRIEPTIAGIRAGKDEVLERAVAYVTNGR